MSLNYTTYITYIIHFTTFKY